MFTIGTLLAIFVLKIKIVFWYFYDKIRKEEDL